MRRLLFLVLLLVTAVSCAAPTCEESTVDYRATVDSLNEQWDDALAIANSTARMSLSGPLGDLQSLNRDTKQIDVPECAASAHEAMLDYQEAIIDAFLAFMGNENDSVVNARFDTAQELQSKWVTRYVGLTVNLDE